MFPSHPAPIGYLVPEFPSQTHAFFWRELQAMEEAGVPVHVFSTRRPSPGSCPHAFARAAEVRTEYLFPPRLGAALKGLVTRPRRTARAVGYLMGLRQTPFVGRLKLLVLVPTAMALVHSARHNGLSHLHIHSCANAAHLGVLGDILDDLPYSLTLHGDLAVYGTDHAAKMARARFVNPVTHPLQKSLQETIGPGRPYPVIWMGVDTDRFRPVRSGSPRDPATPLRALTVARLNEKKGHLYFLRAMAQLKTEGITFDYRIAGDGPFRSEIEAEIAKLGLTDHVTLLGSIPEDQVLEQLQQTDISVLTSYGMGEAAPVSVMEAMACGVPCIVSIIGGTRDMITHAEDGMLVAQQDVEAIGDALRAMASDPALLEHLSQKARATAEAMFDHRTNARKLCQAIFGDQFSP